MTGMTIILSYFVILNSYSLQRQLWQAAMARPFWCRREGVGTCWGFGWISASAGQREQALCHEDHWHEPNGHQAEKGPVPDLDCEFINSVWTPKPLKSKAHENPSSAVWGCDQWGEGLVFPQTPLHCVGTSETEHRLLQSCLDNWHLWISDTCGLRKMQTRRFESKHVKTMKNNETYHNEKYSTSVGGSKPFKPFLALQRRLFKISINPGQPCSSFYLVRTRTFNRELQCDWGRTEKATPRIGTWLLWLVIEGRIEVNMLESGTPSWTFHTYIIHSIYISRILKICLMLKSQWCAMVRFMQLAMICDANTFWSFLRRRSWTMPTVGTCISGSNGLDKRGRSFRKIALWGDRRAT